MRLSKSSTAAISLVLLAVGCGVGCGVDRTALQPNPDGSDSAGSAGSGSGAAGSGTGSAGNGTGAAGSGTGAAGTGSAGNGTGAAGSGTGAAGSGTGAAGNGAAGASVCPALGCAPKCQYGVKVDARGCTTCQCNPAPSCGPVCSIFCQYGNVTDAKGCPTCQCNPPPNGPCSAAECGADPGLPGHICPDGKPAVDVCSRDGNGMCGWHGTLCPATRPTCERNKCPSPAPAAPNVLCADGKTVAGPACVAGTDGACGWTIVTCPTKCVDNVLCAIGLQWDGVLCKCVPTAPLPDKCACPVGQVCVQQLGGPAIQPGADLVPPFSPCETPAATCLKTGQSACACLAAQDGKCTASTLSSRSCACDNGIR